MTYITPEWDKLLDAKWVVMPNGYGLFWEKNAAGGRTYFSDEVGGGVGVWNTALVDPNTILFAIAIESGLAAAERRRDNKDA